MLLFVLTQLTFVDVIFMYSNSLLTEIGMSEVMLTFLVSLVNFITAIIGLVLLNYAGRRILILIGNASMSVILILLGISIKTKLNTLSIVLVLLFITAFEFSVGPIAWVYMAEIMHDKAMSVATFSGFTIMLLIAIFPPLIMQEANTGDSLGASVKEKELKAEESTPASVYIFLAGGIITVGATIFTFFYVKETRNKSQKEI